MIIVFFFNVPANSHPFQWPLSPLSQLGRFPAGEFISKGPTDFLKISPACDMIHSDTFLSSCISKFFCFRRWTPKDSSKPLKGGKVSLTRQEVWRSLGIGGGASHPWNSSRLFSCSSGMTDPQGMVQRLICLFRLSLWKRRCWYLFWASLFIWLVLCLFGIVFQLWKCIQRLLVRDRFS
jgi:hypothetical protein